MPKNIESITMSELFDRASDGNIPILVDIQHGNIMWEDNIEQENGHLRLVNNNAKVKYQGKTYYPAYFSFITPSEDGQKVGNTSVTISAIDQRIIEVIRSIKSAPKCVFEAFYTRLTDTQIVFSKLYYYEFQMDSATWDGITAKWNLVFDSAAQLNVPRVLATVNRCPSITNE